MFDCAETQSSVSLPATGTVGGAANETSHTNWISDRQILPNNTCISIMMHITSFLVLVGLEATQMLCGSVSGLLCGSLCGLQNIVCGRLCGLQNIVSMKTHIHVN